MKAYTKTILLEKKKNKDNQVGGHMADHVTDDYGYPEECFYDIDPGVYDYIIKCVGGVTPQHNREVESVNSEDLPLYENRYFHINTSRKFEIIGSSQREEDQCTICIENANLKPAHCEIKLIEAYNYYIMEKDSDIDGNQINSSPEDRVFIRVPEEGIDLYEIRENKVDGDNRILRLGDTYVTLKMTEEYFNEVDTWIKSNNLEKIQHLVQEANISIIKDLKLQAESIMGAAISQNIISDFEESKKIRELFYEIKPSRLSKKKKHMLQLYFNDSNVKLDLDGSDKFMKILDPSHPKGIQDNIGSNIFQLEEEAKLKHILGKDTLVEDVKAIVPNSYNPEKEIEAVIEYKRGSWWLKDPNHNEMNGVYTMLEKDQKHILVPGDQFKVGHLEFRLERYNTSVIQHAKGSHGSDDTYTIIQDMKIDQYIKCSFFAVYDGHGGSFCAKYLKENFHKVLKEKLTDRFDGIKNSKNIAKSIKNIFEDTCYHVDNEFIRKYEAKSKNCGSTAACVLIIGDRIYCANVGDARAIMSIDGKPLELSWDHNLAREDEKRRIEESGGLEVGRVHGKLSITRAFGDSAFKSQNTFNCLDYNTVLVTPEVREHLMDPFTDEFIVVASDGLYDELESQQVVDFVREKYKYTPEDICHELLDEVLNIREKEDDITIIIVKLQRHLSYLE
ncbi:unnamed protein product [Moneuplotes crassus]|uniref:PPM-type phosphatase domain-containing protein n=1 Tax=Euplotes crassus TaxID=5936 RepID=A0AAD1X6N9_EUPCR|nr:unnamed protein product [Moneuplotes crassus]